MIFHFPGDSQGRPPNAEPCAGGGAPDVDCPDPRGSPPGSPASRAPGRRRLRLGRRMSGRDAAEARRLPTGALEPGLGHIPAGEQCVWGDKGGKAPGGSTGASPGERREVGPCAQRLPSGACGPSPGCVQARLCCWVGEGRGSVCLPLGNSHSRGHLLAAPPPLQLPGGEPWLGGRGGLSASSPAARGATKKCV